MLCGILCPRRLFARKRKPPPSHVRQTRRTSRHYNMQPKTSSSLLSRGCVVQCACPFLTSRSARGQAYTLKHTVLWVNGTSRHNVPEQQGMELGFSAGSHLAPTPRQLPIESCRLRWRRPGSWYFAAYTVAGRAIMRARVERRIVKLTGD